MTATDPLWIAALEDDAAWQVIADAVDAFERQWQMAGSNDDGPDLRPHVRSVPAELRELVLIELIKVDQEYRWRRNQRKSVEAYLREWPDLAARDAAVAELLQAECATQAYCDQETSVLQVRRRCLAPIPATRRRCRYTSHGAVRVARSPAAEHNGRTRCTSDRPSAPARAGIRRNGDPQVPGRGRHGYGVSGLPPSIGARKR